MKVKIKADQLYTPEYASQLLGVKADTVKQYLRDKEMEGKQIGPRKEWRTYGRAILKKRKDFGLD